MYNFTRQGGSHTKVINVVRKSPTCPSDYLSATMAAGFFVLLRLSLYPLALIETDDITE